MDCCVGAVVDCVGRDPAEVEDAGIEEGTVVAGTEEPGPRSPVEEGTLPVETVEDVLPVKVSSGCTLQRDRSSANKMTSANKAITMGITILRFFICISVESSLGTKNAIGEPMA